MKKERLLLIGTLLLVGCGGVNDGANSNGTSIPDSSFTPTISVITPGFTSENSSNEENSSSEEIISSEEISVENSSSEETISSEKISSENVVSSEEVSSELISSEEIKSESTSITFDSEVEEYYKPVDFTKTGKSLMADLEDLLDDTDNTSFSYSSLFNVFANTDIDPDNPNSGKILSFYSGTPSTRSSMNREHVWPDSRGGFLVEDDPHCIRPTLTSENSSRGNSFYNENGSWDPASFDNDKYRGIAARIIFYCAVKAYTEGLYLVDKSDDPRLSSKNSVTNKNWNPTMGKLSTLLKWNLEYDIDETETIRNDVLYEEYNHCRNPFIDNRDLACSIWGDTSTETKKVCNRN